MSGRIRFAALGAAVVLGAAVPFAQGKGAPAVAEPTISVTTQRGVFEIALDPEDAPKSVAHILDLVKRHFYRGLRMHWVQPGIVQFGDPATRDMTQQSSWGTGNSGHPLGFTEFSKKPFVRGSVGMAVPPGVSAKDADSQMFIAKAPSPNLDGKYTYIGHVSKGMDVVDKLVYGDVIKSIVESGGQ